MADPISIISFISAVAGLVQFSASVIKRVDQYQSKAKDIPKVFGPIKAELPVLQVILEKTIKAVDSGDIGDDVKAALVPVVEGCQAEIKSLDNVLEIILPKPEDTRTERLKKAALSLQQESKIKKITERIRKYIQALTYYHAASSSSRPWKEEKLSKFRGWLSPPDPSENHERALKQRTPNTGLWFLESNEYASWKKQPASLIWLHGIPGCGKSVLCSTVIQDVLQNCEKDPGKAVAYFYFDFRDTQKQSTELMVKSLITKFMWRCIRMPSDLESMYNTCENGGQQPSSDALLHALRHVIEGFPDAYIIVDALDECASRAQLMDTIDKLVGWQLEQLHILFTSRKERDIESTLENLVDEHSSIPLQTETVDKDIQTYVRHRLSVDKKLMKWVKDKQICAQIEDVLMKKARGMFRWAACQLDALRGCRTRRQLQQTLQELPAGLDETYDRILTAIKEKDREHAICILGWLAFSTRPLTLGEIAEVVAIDSNSDFTFDPDGVLEEPLEALEICPSLFTIEDTSNYEKFDLEVEDRDEESEVEFPQIRNVVTFAHFSVREYLVSERIRQSPARCYSAQETACNTNIALSCVGYLLQFQDPASLSYEAIDKSRLARYSADFWPQHARAADQSNRKLQQLIIRLLKLRNTACFSWFRLDDIASDINHEIPGINLTRKLEEMGSPLYLASLAGLNEIVRIFLDEGADVNEEGQYHGNALHAASHNGHVEVVKQLLAAKANPNALVFGCGNALYVASYNGHVKVVEQLLAAGDKAADINAQGGDFGNALQAASFDGNEKVVELLLSKGADVTLQGGHFGNALQAASYGGNEKVVELLLSKGAISEIAS